MRIVAQQCPPGWVMARPDLMYGTVIGSCVPVGANKDGIEWPGGITPTWSCKAGYRPGNIFGTCVPIGDAPPIVIEENPGGTVTVQFPLPGGQVITGTVTQPPATPAAAANETLEKVKVWLNQRTILSNYENWKVLAAGAGIALLLKGNK